MAAFEMEDLLEGRRSQPRKLIEVLQDVQEQYGYIPEEAMRITAESLGVAMIDVYSVASFYNAFSLKPSGKNVITVCTGTACHVRGAGLLLDQAKIQLGIKSGEMSEDGLFSVKHVNCLGACALGPMVSENKESHHHVTPGKLRKMINAIQRKEASEESSDD
jgi:NADH:ubiquinone oxidoreductase subunit E